MNLRGILRGLRGATSLRFEYPEQGVCAVAVSSISV